MANTEPKVAKEVAGSIYKDIASSSEFRLLRLLPGSDDVSRVSLR